MLKLIKFLLFVFVIFFTLHILLTGLHVRFWADDFCTAVVHAQHGFWGAQKF